MVASVAAIAGAVIVYRNRNYIGEKLSPTSDKNVVYTGTTSVMDILDDGQRNNSSVSLGSKIYDWLHPNEGEEYRRK